MALPENREAVKGILAEIRPRVIGHKHEGFSCGCGCIKEGPATCVDVLPGGDTYPGQETNWALWSLSFKANPGDSTSHGFSTGLCECIPVKELEEIFARHFGANPTDKNPYELEVRGRDRVERGLPTMVEVKEFGEETRQIRFCFHWGADKQDVAEMLQEIARSRPRFKLNGSPEFDEVVEILSGMSPEVHIGGPEPELASETTYHKDYQEALELAKKAQKVFFQNGGSSLGQGGKVFTKIDAAFIF